MGCILSCKKNSVEEVAEAPRPVSLSPPLPSPPPPFLPADDGFLPEAAEEYGWAGSLGTRTRRSVLQQREGDTCDGGEVTVTRLPPKRHGVLGGWVPALSDVNEDPPSVVNSSRPKNRRYMFTGGTSEYEREGPKIPKEKSPFYRKRD